MIRISFPHFIDKLLSEILPTPTTIQYLKDWLIIKMKYSVPFTTFIFYQTAGIDFNVSVLVYQNMHIDPIEMYYCEVMSTKVKYVQINKE